MSSRLPILEPDQIEDESVHEILDRAEKLSTPKPAWYQTLAHNPEMTKAYADFWEITHRGGIVPHTIKELMRITIATLLDCDFCADQRSVMALEAGLDEDEMIACTLPDFNHPDLRTRAALRFARAMAKDNITDAEYDTVYNELKQVYSHAEIVELGCFAAIAVGGVKLSRSLRITI